MGTDRNTRALHAALQRLQATLQWPEERLYVRADSVSAWSPAQHVQHALLALDRMLKAIEALCAGAPEVSAKRGHVSLQGRALLLCGWIPRGRARTPDFAAPDEIPSHAGLLESQATTCQAFGALAPRAGGLGRVRGTLEHPVLGALNAAQWWRFARVHTEHHLTIIADIDRRRGVGALLPDEAPAAGDACP